MAGKHEVALALGNQVAATGIVDAKLLLALARSCCVLGRKGDARAWLALAFELDGGEAVWQRALKDTVLAKACRVDELESKIGDVMSEADQAALDDMWLQRARLAHAIPRDCEEITCLLTKDGPAFLLDGKHIPASTPGLMVDYVSATRPGELKPFASRAVGWLPRLMVDQIRVARQQASH
jgi:hypothetical protein